MISVAKKFQFPDNRLQTIAHGFASRIRQWHGYSVAPFEAMRPVLAMANVFFLCSVANHTARVQSDENGRQRCTLPDNPYLQAALDQCGIPRPKQRDSYSQSPTYVLRGLVQAVPGIAVGDVIRPYSHREELFVWQAFWRDAADGFTIVSKEVFRFDTPIPVVTCIGAGPSSETYPLQRRRNALSPFLPYGVSLDEFGMSQVNFALGRQFCPRGLHVLHSSVGGFRVKMPLPYLSLSHLHRFY